MNSPTPGVPHGEYDGPDEDWIITDEDRREAKELQARIYCGEIPTVGGDIFRPSKGISKPPKDGLYCDVGVDQPDDEDDQEQA